VICGETNPLAQVVCCGLGYLCAVGADTDPCEENCTTDCSQSATGPAEPAVVQPAGADDTIRFDRLYRLRDRVFHGHAGGERATELYYRHSFAFGTAFVSDPALANQAIDTLRLWQPGIDALLAGTPDTVTPERLQALRAFLDALRPAASPLLAAAIDHGRRRIGLDTWEGISLTDALARLDGLVCAVAATYPSVVCRLEDTDEIAIAGVPAGKLATKITTSLERAITEAGEAAAATDDARLARRHTRKAGRFARKVAKRVKSRSGRKTIPEATRTELTALLEAVRTDLKTLAH
jgi:hypothetical protein